VNGLAPGDNWTGLFKPGERVRLRLINAATMSYFNVRIPGLAIVVVHGDKTLLLKGFGTRVAGQAEPIDGDTVFQLASVSKPLTATILARLVGQGRLKWDDRVIDHDPAFQLSDPWMTRDLRLNDLLSHRSGLPDHAGDQLEDLGYPREEIVRRLRYLPSREGFRTHYAYTNFGYSQAAYAVAKRLKTTWEDLAEKEFFKPLGMTSTSYRHADFVRHDNRAKLHVKVDGEWQPKFERQPDAQSPAGGASSNLNDLAIWLRLLLENGQSKGETFIDATALAETQQPHSALHLDAATGRFGSYGMGWNIGIEHGQRVSWKHSGAFDLGVRTQVALIPSEQLAIAVLVNSGPHGVPEGLTESFLDWVFEGELQRDWVALANLKFEEMVQETHSQVGDFSKPVEPRVPPAALSNYVGDYDQDFFGPVSVISKQGQLALLLGPQKTPFLLQHWNRDWFVYQPSGESSPGPSGVQFVMDQNGRAVRLRLENLRYPELGPEFGEFLRREAGKAE